jgi:hypothetical protein
LEKLVPKGCRYHSQVPRLSGLSDSRTFPSPLPSPIFAQRRPYLAAGRIDQESSSAVRPSLLDPWDRGRTLHERLSRTQATSFQDDSILRRSRLQPEQSSRTRVRRRRRRSSERFRRDRALTIGDSSDRGWRRCWEWECFGSRRSDWSGRSRWGEGSARSWGQWRRRGARGSGPRCAQTLGELEIESGRQLASPSTSENESDSWRASPSTSSLVC